MGNAVPKLDGMTLSPTDASSQSARKRAHHSHESDEQSEIVEEAAPRQKIRKTSLYIYETMFVQGANADVVIAALGKEWRLHRIYLCQSSYFSALFNGNWKDSNDSRIEIEILDPNITKEALHATFGSLYKDDVTLTTDEVVSVLATSRMLQVEGLLEQCIGFMTSHITPEVVCVFYQAAREYGLESVELQCFEWLQQRLMTAQSVTLLKELSGELLLRLVVSPKLFVMQVEMDLYTLVKEWLYLQLFPNSTVSDIVQLQKEADAHFSSLKSGEFLDTEAGKPYRDIFKGIRFQHIINDASSVRILDRESIIPQSWLLPLYKKQWQKMLKVNQKQDHGPSMNEDVFDATCIRCGRILQQNGEYCWRWTGYLFGFDVLVSFSNGFIFFKRNTYSQPCLSSVSLQSKRAIALKVTAASFDASGRPTFKKSTDFIRVVFAPDEEVLVMTLEKPVRFPLHLSVSMALVSE
ncbi:germ cell-less protein-like 1 [Oscarella lobularis]|uniref:germ cell-less protein-like 1 n=1 Tax=Oscarella lobularis TaxID=121494 RepID=UPI0033136371